MNLFLSCVMFSVKKVSFPTKTAVCVCVCVWRGGGGGGGTAGGGSRGKMAKKHMKITKSAFLGQNSGGYMGKTSQFFSYWGNPVN